MSALHNHVSQCTTQLLSAAPSLIGTAQIWPSVQLQACNMKQLLKDCFGIFIDLCLASTTHQDHTHQQL